jgi:hypothetical protein
VTSLFEASGDLAAAESFVGEAAGESDDLLLWLIGHKLLALGTPTERRAPARVATRS